MKILVITTGGTVGSVYDGSAINVASSQSSAVVELYKAEHSDADFTVSSPVNILSESVTAADLTALARALLTADLSSFDGLILTCGSDNLAHIASFTALLTARDNIPVAVIASDKILSDPSANGYPNFLAAAALIRRGVPGAFVPYRGADGVMYIHSAFDIRQADLSDDFYSFDPVYAVMENDDIIFKSNYIKHNIPPVFSPLSLPVITDSVLLIRPCPLFDYAAVSTDGYRAVLHTLYHSSTLDSTRAVPFIKALGDTPCFLSSFRSGHKLYQTAADAISAGALPLYDMSPECAYMKLLLACAQSDMSIRDFMSAGEE